MTAEDILNLGNKFHSEGKVDVAIELFKEAISVNPSFSAPYLNLQNIYMNQGNIQAAKDCLVKFLSCPITGFTQDIIPQIKAQLSKLEQQLSPHPTPPPQQVK